MSVHVVGNVCIDWRLAVTRLPLPGETLNAHDLTFDLGGKGALQAVAASRTGAATHLVAAIGEDAEGERVRALLRAAGIADGGLARVEAPTDRSVILVDAAGENAIVSAVAAARAFRPPSGWSAATSRGDLLLVQNNLLPAVTAQVLNEAQRSGLRAVWNVSPLGEGETVDLAPAALAVVNRGEGEALTGAADPADILAALRARGAREAVVTLGADGAAVLPAGQPAPAFVAARRVAAVDTSGAGDVFCGVLCGLLDRGADLVAAAGVATAAAALAVTRAGTCRAIPSRSEIEAIATRGSA